MLRRLIILCLVGFMSVTLVLGGCTGTRDNKLNQVKLGMTKAEVLKIIGEPQEHETKNIGSLTGEILRWRTSNQTIILTFDNKNRLSGKEIVGHAAKAQKG